MELKNRNILVAGGAHRLGRAVTLALAERGANVSFTYWTSKGPAAETLRALHSYSPAHSPTSRAYRCNLTNVGQIRALMARYKKEHGALHAFIHVAAIFEKIDFFKISEKAWNTMIDTNLKATFFASQAAAQLMQKNRLPAHIILFTDTMIDRPRIHYLHYCASKAGVENLAKGLARRLAPRIRVNAIAPGAVLLPENHTQQERKEAQNRNLLKRLGSPHDVVEATLFLLEKGDFLTGQIIRVDGGAHLL